jgi:hypothetical protein
LGGGSNEAANAHRHAGAEICSIGCITGGNGPGDQGGLPSGRGVRGVYGFGGAGGGSGGVGGGGAGVPADGLREYSSDYQEIIWLKL